MIAGLLSVLGAATPTPAPDFDEDLATPTWVGFAITFLVALATVFLLMDMVRRVRRTRYRGEIQERLDAERAAGGGTEDGETEGGDPESGDAVGGEQGDGTDDGTPKPPTPTPRG